MDPFVDKEVDLHQVKRVAEVRANAANELLESGWVLHEIYFTSDRTEERSRYILLCMDEPACPRCGAPASLEVLDDGERVRYVCTKECG